MTTTNANSAKLEIDGKVFSLPIVVGTENEKAVDISTLRAQTGYITLDDGFGNTGSCQSKVTFIDGEQGILRYRGIPIEELAQKSTFIETAYLLIYGQLPTTSNCGGSPINSPRTSSCTKTWPSTSRAFPAPRTPWRCSRP